MDGRRGWVVGIVAAIPVAFLLIFFLWPVATLIGRGFFDDAGALSASGVLSVLGSPRTWRIVGQTLGQATVGTLVSVLLGVPGAYVLYCQRFRGQRVLRALVSVPFVLPSVVVGVAFSSLLSESGWLGGLGLSESFTAVVLALVFFNYSLVVRTVGVLWARLDVRTTQAARTLGASGLRAFWTVTLPALKPAIASAAALTFLFCASAFGVVLVLGGVSYGTVETEIYYQTTQLLDLPAAAALSVLQLVIICACLLVTNRMRARNERALRLQTARPGRNPGSVVLSAITGVTIALVALPLLSLVYRSLQTADGFGLGNYLLLGQVAGKATTVSVWTATGNSLWTALWAAILALGLGTLTCYVLSRRPRSPGLRFGLRLFDSAFMLPLGVSAVTVGFGFLITLNRPPFDLRTSWVLIPLAQALVALPLVVRTLLPTWRAIDPRLQQAAATLGASPWRVLYSVDLRLLRRAFGLAAGFAFATSLGEFGATSFLARADRPTLPVVIYRLISRPGVENLGMALAASVVLAVLTGLIMLTAERLGGENAWI
ncbi:MAG: iron ABC transporter permease [Propionibacteriaceae bacterium]|nr:iron ABC transporter permease [Propionibacteriaceae bacterium]